MKAIVPNTPGKPISTAFRAFAFLTIAAFLIYALGLGVLTYYRVIGPDKWWVTGFLLYLPSWPWAIPAAILFVPLLIVARRIRGPKGVILALSATAVLWYAAGPQTGLCFNLPPRAYNAATEQRLRVLTYNVKWGYRDVKAVAQEVVDSQPDLVLFQDSADVRTGELGRALSPQNGWTVRVSGQYVVASRLPLSELTDIDISFPGSNHHAVRATLQPPSGPPITVFTVHLLSPRSGLGSVRHRNSEGMSDNIDARLFESHLLAQAVRSVSGPIVLTGDLNAPSTSLICRELEQTGLRDAWKSAGFGWGYTYGITTKARHSYVRIDHIMANESIRFGPVHVGNSEGSDHCPVIADLYLPR